MAETNKRNSGTDRLASRLIFSMPLLPDELLSSWLVRLAFANGVHPLTLTDVIWPKWRVWMLDLDRGVAPERECQATEFLGVASDVWQAATLRDIAYQVSGGLPSRPGVWPWVLAIGARNRRRSGGLQYCPECLATDSIPYFRLRWRLAWHIACETHRVYLRDDCPVCASPLEPHRLGPECDHPAMCAHCAADFTKGDHCERANPDILRFQKLADGAVLCGKAMFHDQSVSARAWFEMAGFLAALVRREQCGNSKSLTCLLTTLDANSARVPVRVGAGIEKLRLYERRALLPGVAKLMFCDGQNFADALQSSGASQQCLSGLGLPVPDCLREFVDDLPQRHVSRWRGRMAGQRRRQPSEVRRMMISLERRMLGGER